MTELFLLLFMLWLNVKAERMILQVPNIKPEQDNVYICMAKHLTEHPRYYITAIRPEKVGHIHHMDVWFCKDLATDDEIWDCGGYKNENRQKSLNNHKRCQSSMDLNLLYTWSYNTTNAFLPKDASFEVGTATSLKHLVLEVHYADASAYKDGETDDTRIALEYTTERTEKRGGLLMTSPFVGVPVPANQKTVVTVATPLDSVMYPTFYQVHTHELGTKVVGYLVKRKEGGDEWTKLGERDPMGMPQVYVPVETEVRGERGDFIAHSCTYVNTRDTDNIIGPLGENEMCNFYVMYWSEWDEGAYSEKHHLAPVLMSGPWDKFQLNNLPEDD